MPKKTINLSYSKDEIENALRKVYNLPEDAFIRFRIGHHNDPTDYFSEYPPIDVLESAEVSYESKDS